MNHRMGSLMLMAALWTIPALRAANPAPAAETGAGSLAAPEKPPASRVSHGTNDDVIITLDAETQQRIGLAVTRLTATNLAAGVKGFGRVLDPLPLIQLVAELGPAEVTANAARREFERLQTLRAQDNASERALQAAEAQAQRDLLAAAGLRAKLRFAWGETLATTDNLPELAQSLVGMQAALVRVDLPAGTTPPGRPTGVTLARLTTNASVLAGTWLGPATSTDPAFQGQGFLFLVRDQPLAPGTALSAFIACDGPISNGVVIPAAAVVRHERGTWVYQRTAPNRFTRRAVGLDRVLGSGYFVTRGFQPDDDIVSNAAQWLLSEELKGEGAGE